MPKISRHGGPSYTLAEPGDTATDALQRESALHPEEQNALLLDGTENEDEWLRNKDGYDDRGYPVDENRERDEAEPAANENDPKPGRGEQSSPGDNSSRFSEKQTNSDDSKKAPLPKRVRTTENPSSETTKGA